MLNKVAQHQQKAKLIPTAAVWLLLLLLLSVGRPLSAQSPTPAETLTNIDVVLVLDTSGSMRANDPDALRVPAAKLFVDLASPGDKFGIITMSGQRQTVALTEEMIEVSNFTSRTILKEVIDGATQTTSGGTYMGQALDVAYDLLERSPENPQRVVLLLTDGLPDPSSQREQVTEAVGRFQQRPDWPLFVIALGADADVTYLQTNITEPTGGRVFAATSAAELVDVYLQVFAQLLDDRYIQSFSLTADEPAPLASLSDDYRLSQLSFVLHRDVAETNLTELSAPNQDNLAVGGSRGGVVYRSRELPYEVVTVFPDGEVPLAGSWSAELTSPLENGRMTMMVRSDLRARWLLPRPTNPIDDKSIRYVPSGRPWLLQLGAVDRLGGLAADLAPAAEIPAEVGNWLETRDDGQDWDFVGGDGRGTTVYEEELPPGNYTMRVEVPRFSEDPIHLYKTYLLEARPLPQLRLEVAAADGELGIGGVLNGEIYLDGLDEVELEGVEEIEVIVREPNGRLIPVEVEVVGAPVVEDVVAIEPTATPRPNQNAAIRPTLPEITLPFEFSNRQEEDPLFRFSYTPESLTGDLRVMVVANILASEDRLFVPYTDFSQKIFSLSVPTISIDSPTGDVSQVSRQRVVLPVEVTTDGLREESLTLSLTGSGLSNPSVFPPVLTVPAEPGTHEFSVELYTENAPGQTGEAVITFESEPSTALLEDNIVRWVVRTVGSLNIRQEEEEAEIIPIDGGEVVVYLQSGSNQPERLLFEWDGSPELGELTVVPAEFIVPPGEETQITLKLFSTAESGAEGEVRLRAVPPDGQLQLREDDLVWQARVGRPSLGFGPLIACFGVVVAGVVAFLMIRRRQVG